MADTVETNKKNQEQPSGTGQPEAITQEVLDDFFTKKAKGLFEATTNLDKKIEELKSQIPNLDDRIRRVEDRIDDTRTNIIETIGILIGLFTFISIEFQIFKSNFSLQEAGGLTMIILGGMLLFIATIDFFIKLDLPLFKKELNKEIKTVVDKGFWIRLIFFVLSIALIICGVILFSTSDQKVSNIEKQESSQNIYTGDEVSSPGEIQKIEEEGSKQ